MDDFKKIYLVELSFNYNDLRVVEFEDDFDAKVAAETLSKFFHPGEIQLLQIRIRYDKNEEDNK